VKVIVAESEGIASRQAAAIVADNLKNKPNTAFLLPTGSTPVLLYELLREKVAAGRISFTHAKTFNLDEYVGIKSSNPQSYHFFMNQNLFNKIDIKKSNINIPDGTCKNPQEYCENYEDKIHHSEIDLAILGIGKNGHIGFNEPGTSFDSTTHIAELTPSTVEANARFFKTKDEVPTKAITVGLRTIMNAKSVILLAFGKNKAEAIRDAIEKPANENLPASILQNHKNAIFIIDQEAASLLKNTPIEPPTLGNIKLYSEFNLPKNKKIVFFSPHPDDAAICAGAILTTLAKNNEVHEIILTTGHRAVGIGKNSEQKALIREQEARKEAKVLKTKIHFMECHYYDNGKDICEEDLKRVRDLMQKITPNIAFVPQKSDPHPTHVQSRKIALASLPHDIDLWSFETPWGLFAHEKLNAAFEFGEKVMRVKMSAIQKHKSQIERTRFDLAAKGIASFRRITIAEQFFSELGKKSLETEPYLELFNISRW